MLAFNEQNLRMGEQVVSASNECSGPYTEAPIPEYHITWHYITSSSSSEALTEEGYYIPGHADRILTVEEYATLRELLNNHPEIKSWWIKNNVLYLVMEDEEGSKRKNDRNEADDI